MDVAVGMELDIFVKPATFQHEKPRGGGGQEIPVMGDDQFGRGQGVENAHEAFPRGRVQAGGRFIEKQQSGPHGQDPGESHKAHFSSREPVGEAVGKVVETEEGQSLFGSEAGLWGRKPLVERAKGHVVEHRGVKELVLSVLQAIAHGQTELPELGFATYLLTAKEDLAPLGALQAREQTQESSFATTIGANEPHLILGREA